MAARNGLRAVTLALVGLGACSGPTIPPPEGAARRFAAAVRQGDAAAVRALLDRETRLRTDEKAVSQLLDAHGRELEATAGAIEKGPLVVEQQAQARFVDGETARLTLENGQFRLASSAGLPSRPETPAEALAALRGALSRRSYAALILVLSSENRSALERDLNSLVEGLEDPGSLPVDIDGDRAEVTVPGGHKVWLRRESGLWKVHDFE